MYILHFGETFLQSAKKLNKATLIQVNKKLEKFIKKLEEIKRKQGGDLRVVMADNISVVEPVFLKEYLDKKVIITDHK